MFKLPMFKSSGAKREAQPFSRQTQQKHSRTDGAVLTHSVCPYCAVGCSLNVFTKGGRIIDIEGNPDSPINEGALCPKGANSFQLAVNPHRVKHVMYRAPYSDHWERKPLEWAMDRIAHLVKDAREEGYEATTPDGLRLGAVKNIGTLGGATLDNEENYLIKKLFNAGLGVLPIENQARI